MRKHANLYSQSVLCLAHKFKCGFSPRNASNVYAITSTVLPHNAIRFRFCDLENLVRFFGRVYLIKVVPEIRMKFRQSINCIF